MTVALVANIARPISSAISTAFSADSYGKLDAYGKIGAWSPLSLFSAGEVGAWYDPSDLTTMFQDRAGTTPVTADGQTVGKILDKSGRGNHATAPSDAARPLYKTDGTYHWLQFDGVDDSLSTAAINFTGTHYMSSFVGFSNHLIDLYSHVYAIGDGLQGNVPGGAWLYIIDTGYPSFANQSTTVTSNFIGSSIAGTPGAIPIDTPQVAAGVYDCAGATFNDVVKHIAIDPWDDGKTWTQIGTGFNGTGTYGNLPLILGRLFSRTFNGNIYSLIIRGALSTTDEITNTETWVNQRTGAY